MINSMNLIIQHWPWPVVVLILVFVFRKNLSKLIFDIESLKTGSIEIAFKKQIQKQGFTENQVKGIQNLTNLDMNLFMMVSFTNDPGFDYKIKVPKSEFKESMLRLEASGLIEIVNPEDPGSNIRHIITPAGFHIKSLLINASMSLMKNDINK